VASAPEQLALLVFAHLLPALLDHAAHRLSSMNRDGGRDWLVAHRFEVNGQSAVPLRRARCGRAVQRGARSVIHRSQGLQISGLFRFSGRNSRVHHLDFFVIVA
jgi:hypothetical protein